MGFFLHFYSNFYKIISKKLINLLVGKVVSCYYTMREACPFGAKRAGPWLDYFFFNAFMSFEASSKHLGSNANTTIIMMSIFYRNFCL